MKKESFNQNTSTSTKKGLPPQTVYIRFQRRGDNFSLSFSKPLPPVVIKTINSILLHAAIWSQTKASLNHRRSPMVMRGSISNISTSKTYVYATKTNEINSPTPVNINGIISSMDTTVIRVIQGVIGAFYTVYGNEPVLVAYEDDKKTLQVRNRFDNSEVESEGWVTSIIAALPALLAEGGKEAGKLAIEILIDLLYEMLKATNTDNQTPDPMRTPDPQDMGTNGETSMNEFPVSENGDKFGDTDPGNNPGDGDPGDSPDPDDGPGDGPDGGFGGGDGGLRGGGEGGGTGGFDGGEVSGEEGGDGGGGGTGSHKRPFELTY